LEDPNVDLEHNPGIGWNRHRDADPDDHSEQQIGF
jgi:hypothetical protein